jgi:hypothetical protein
MEIDDAKLEIPFAAGKVHLQSLATIPHMTA